jgi:gliding motility-associated-like protein
MKKLYCICILLSTFFSVSGQSQLLSGNAFLQGSFVEVGINQCGSFGTTNNAPAGFHARSGAAASPTTNQLNLGFVADIGKDGWTVGTPRYAGDYFLPFTPRVGWGISFNGNHYRVERTGSSVTNCITLAPAVPPFPGSNISVTSNAQQSVATWSGTANGLQLEKIVTVKREALFFTVKIKLKNTGATTLNNIYYGDYVNPDHGFYNNDVASGNAATTNSIVHQINTDNQSLVQSIATNNQYYLGIGSKDCRSKVFRGVNNYFDPNPTNVQQWYDGSIAGIGYTGADNPAPLTNSIIGIGFDAGSLNAGDSTSFLFTYILNAADFNEALANTAPGFSINNINYNSNDAASVCVNGSIPVSLTNAEDYDWSWLPATGVMPATGASVNISIGNAPVQYIATGVGPCGTVRDTINLFPRAGRLYVDSSVTVSGNGNSWASPLKTVTEALDVANNLNCANEIWVKKGTYYPMRNTTAVATSRDSSFRILRDGIKLYGGFAGNETLLTQRVTGTNLSVLSANIGAAGSIADNSYHVLTIFTLNNTGISNNTAIDGFTITAGNANGAADYTYNDTIILNTRAGGIFCWVASPHISNCIIDNNIAEGNGGGLYSYLGSGLYDSLLITNNHATSPVNGLSHGGGIFNSGGRSVFKNCTVKGNSSTWDGGGFYNVTTASIIENAIIDSNTAVYGGGFYTRGGADTLLNVTIRGNTATGGNGAVYNIGNTIFTNGLITGNFSPSGSGWGNVGGDAILTNITIAGNRATGDNAGIYHGFGNMQVRNCIVWNNQAASQANISVLAPAILTVGYSNIQGAIYPGTGNINSNPFFIASLPPASAPVTSGNYRLDPCQSLSLDAGLNAWITTSADIEGNTRIQNGVVDMGAYETSANIYDVTIASNPGMTTPVCTGNAVTFTATPVNAGPNTPAYQWLLNGTPIAGAVNATYTTGTLAHSDIVQVVMIPNNGCIPRPDSSNSIIANMTASLTPAISVVASQTNICVGTSVTFTATPVNGGANPLFQWQINGSNAGTNSSTFTSSTLNNNDVVTVTLNSSLSCITANNIISNSIAIQVTNNVTASVSITASQLNFCAGSAATFTAVAVNAGTAPIYQWQVNGINQGTDNAVFTSTTLNNNDVVMLMLTSNAACVAGTTVSSNTITVAVNNTITPTVTIAASQNSICAGTAVTFTASVTGQGTAPAFQWQVNGANTGTDNSIFISSSLNNNDVVTAILTSNETCLVTNNVTSNSINMQVTALVSPTINITASQQTICAGTNVVFTATSTNGGSNPVYQWKLNGANVGNNSYSYSSSTLNNDDEINVVLTSNAGCIAINNVNSNSISITVNPVVRPSVTVSADKNILCGGEAATFTATAINGGVNPAYQWKINGIDAGNNSAQFTYAAFNDNDIVTVVLTSNAACPSVNNVESNAVTVTVADNPVLTLTAGNTEILEGGSTALHATSTEPISSYVWTPVQLLTASNTANPVASPVQQTTFTLNATSVAGCKATASIIIKVVKGALIANTFSPNGDGINELWLIKNLETYPKCRVQVFTRTGQLVFESHGYRQPWNGTFKGKSLPFDTYYYILEINNRIGSKPITGYVTIIK